MELKEFILKAVSDITAAVSELQSLNNGAVINPVLPNGTTGTHTKIDGKVRSIERLNFDIAVMASEETNGSGGLSVGGTILGLKVSGGDSDKKENVSMLSFSIPIILPSAKVNF